jgi:hypothetical protein
VVHVAELRIMLLSIKIDDHGPHRLFSPLLPKRGGGICKVWKKREVNLKCSITTSFEINLLLLLHHI